MSWDESLLPEQKTAAAHAGNHARLLAGPGTGKTLTLTRHICHQIEERKQLPNTILAITFTRAAARELRQRVSDQLGEQRSPRISTLHSFALRQLLKNANKITDLPQPLRIADDWEERYIVLEDLKMLLKLKRVNDARELLNQLSADWQSLTADDTDWEKKFPDARFLGAWREHRQVFGYTLRAELVYQLKKALEQRGDFQLESPIRHLLVDEYQDLNRCDLAIVEQIESRGAELFVAGDDDQSIYGFRKADPAGIRRFPQDYSGATDLELRICMRCDKAILDLALFVARQDYNRIEKTIQAEQTKAEGEVELLRFNNQNAEAIGITSLCKYFIEKRKISPNDILILLRSDFNGAFSQRIREQLESAGISVGTGVSASNPMDEDNGRAFLAFLRLRTNADDALAWRTLLDLWCKGVGKKAISALYQLAVNRNENCAQTANAAYVDKYILPTNHRTRLFNAIEGVHKQMKAMFNDDPDKESTSIDELMKILENAAQHIIPDIEYRKAVISKCQQVAGVIDSLSVAELVRTMGIASEDVEQDLEEGKVNILTMHRAKGLTSEVVIVAAAEDEYIPGRAEGMEIGDERRLLYVSLTRAMHHLFVTYCDRRIGRQAHSGRNSGQQKRTLTRFLVDSPYVPKNGWKFVDSYIGN